MGVTGVGTTAGVATIGAGVVMVVVERGGVAGAPGAVAFLRQKRVTVVLPCLRTTLVTTREPLPQWRAGFTCGAGALALAAPAVSSSTATIPRTRRIERL